MREIWTHYRYKLGRRGVLSEEWSDRGAVDHAVQDMQTDCGVRVGSARQGWIKSNATTATYQPSCLRCLARVGK